MASWLQMREVDDGTGGVLAFRLAEWRPGSGRQLELVAGDDSGGGTTPRTLGFVGVQLFGRSHCLACWSNYFSSRVPLGLAIHLLAVN